MQHYEKLSRKYKYRMKQKYQEDPFAFIVLWSLFFSAVFLVFAFRGLIAATFMSKIDTSNEIIQNESANATNDVADNSTATADNQIEAENNATVSADDSVDNSTNNTADNSIDEFQNTVE